MVTTIKDIARYVIACRQCGETLEFASNQKAGAKEYVMCKCYALYTVRLNQKKGFKNQMNRCAESTKLRRDIFGVFSDLAMGVTVRQAYYRLVGIGYPKTEDFYGRVQRELLHMRQEGVLPYSFIIDNSRRRIKYQSFTSGQKALNQWMRNYRQDVWSSLDSYLEIWLEKKALQGIFDDVCFEYDVPLCVSSGFASEDFIYRSAEAIQVAKQAGKKTVIFYFSDYDPSGIKLAESVDVKLRRFGVDFDFERVALTPEQINTHRLTTRATKQSNHSRGFYGESCELDAMESKGASYSVKTIN